MGAEEVTRQRDFFSKKNLNKIYASFICFEKTQHALGVWHERIITFVGFG